MDSLYLKASMKQGARKILLKKNIGKIMIDLTNMVRRQRMPLDEGRLCHCPERLISEHLDKKRSSE